MALHRWTIGTKAAPWLTLLVLCAEVSTQAWWASKGLRPSPWPPGEPPAPALTQVWRPPSDAASSALSCPLTHPAALPVEGMPPGLRPYLPRLGVPASPCPQPGSGHIPTTGSSVVSGSGSQIGSFRPPGNVWQCLGKFLLSQLGRGWGCCALGWVEAGRMLNTCDTQQQRWSQPRWSTGPR